jgi:hypothetical protein
MSEREKTVMRFRDGRILKGYVKDFSPERNDVIFDEAGTGRVHTISLEDMKAVFFVRSFEGDDGYREKKSYGIRPTAGNRAFVRFKDGERMVGFLEGNVPWEKGFFLSGSEEGAGKGFFLLPVDEDANNVKVFVVSSSVDDVTVVPY